MFYGELIRKLGTVKEIEYFWVWWTMKDIGFDEILLNEFNLIYLETIWYNIGVLLLVLIINLMTVILWVEWNLNGS